MLDALKEIVNSFGIKDFIDIVIVTFLIYKLLGYIRESRAEQLVKGLLVFIVATLLADLLNLTALHWILIGTMQFGVIALVIVFQPELRRALEHVGRSKFFRGQLVTVEKDGAKTLVTAIVKAVDYFSSNKVGALLVIEQEVTLGDFAESGTILNAQVSTPLLENIFFKDSPLHDGAAIVRQDMVYAAGCILPLSRKGHLGAEMGTRHRAGIGITEVSDCIAIVVSEETGIISIAESGDLKRFLEIKELEKRLLALYLRLDKPTFKERPKEFVREMLHINKHG